MTKLLKSKSILAALLTSTGMLNVGLTAAHAQDVIDIASASGASHARFPASNAIDGNTAFASRFASRENPDDLFLDLGSVQGVGAIEIAWGRGDIRSYEFEVATREQNNDNWTTVFSGNSAGNTLDFENYDISDSDARFIRVRGLSNTAGSAWTNITEVQVIGASSALEELHVVSASGVGHSRFPASNTLDNDLNFESRFASRENPDDLFLNLGVVSRIEDVEVAWGRGDDRTYTFEIATRATENGNWNTVFSGNSSGSSDQFERYDVNDTDAQYVRIRGLSNSAGSAWTNITETQVFGRSLLQNGQIAAYEGTPNISDTFLGFLTGQADYNGRGTEYDQIDYEGSPQDYRVEEADEAGTFLVFKPDGGNDVLVSIDGLFFEGSGEQFNIEDLVDAPPNGGGGGDPEGLEHFGEPITLVGANIAWSNDAGFSADFGGFNPLNIGAYRNRFDQIEAAGGNSARIWLHTTAQVTPAINQSGVVTGLSNFTTDQVVLDQLRDVLDEAWDRGIVVTFSLFSFDMFCDTYSDDFSYTSIQDMERHRLMIENNFNSYINNALTPIVNALRDHPGLFAYEVFNEPEGAIRNMTGAGHFCTDEASMPGDGLTFGPSLSGVQRFVNRVAAAVHDADPNVKVTTSTHTDFFDAFSNQTLTSQAGADPDGTLDFYELHFYETYENPPYSTNANVYNADRPIIIGEYDLEQVQQESSFTVAPRDSITEMINNGYAGGWPWSLVTGNVGDIQQAISDVPNRLREIDRAAVEQCINTRDSSCYNE